MQKMKDDFKKNSYKNVFEMNALLEQQREQVETIRTLRQEKQEKLDAQYPKEQLHTF